MKTKKEGIIFVVLALIILIALIILMGLDIPLWVIFLDLVCIGLGVSMIIDEKKAVNTETREDIVSSKVLHSKVNEDLKKEGKPTIEAINTYGGVSTNNLAHKDKSWNNVPDFFVKILKKK